jgi:glycosyltransferase involved in cell wall biosynthesis
VTAEKGVADAIELARTTGRTLRMAAKVYDQHEEAYFAEVVQPAIDDGIVEFLGELGPPDRDAVYAGALATVMLGAWPEPFGLVAIESLATGTPVIARRAGALTETIEHGVDGFLVDDLDEAALAIARVGELDRVAIRRRAVERFSPERMVDEYEAIYRRLVGEEGAAGEGVR